MIGLAEGTREGVVTRRHVLDIVDVEWRSESLRELAEPECSPAQLSVHPWKRIGQ